jgi:hypothetical protein
MRVFVESASVSLAYVGVATAPPHSFQVKFDRKQDVAERQKRLAAQFYVTLQQDVQDWLVLGVTKTGTVYRLTGNEPQSHE